MLTAGDLADFALLTVVNELDVARTAALAAQAFGSPSVASAAHESSAGSTR